MFVGVSPLQDQIDTLTFQNQSLKAKADRFEEALKKNTEEQLKVDGNCNCTVIKLRASKCDSHLAIQWIAMGSLTQGQGGRSQPRPQILSSDGESEILAYIHHFLILLLFLYSFTQHLFVPLFPNHFIRSI